MAVSSLRTELPPSQAQVENAPPPKESGPHFPNATYDPQLMADSAGSAHRQTTNANFTPAQSDSGIVSDEGDLDELVSIKSP